MVGSVVTVVNTFDQQAIMSNKKLRLHLTTILAHLTKEKAQLYVVDSDCKVAVDSNKELQLANMHT